MSRRLESFVEWIRDCDHAVAADGFVVVPGPEWKRLRRLLVSGAATVHLSRLAVQDSQLYGACEERAGKIFVDSLFELLEDPCGTRKH